MTEQLILVVSLLVIGYLLLALEIFVVPGIGVPGIAGLLCLIAACVLAWRVLGTAGGAGLVIGVLVLTTLLGAWLPRTPLGRWVVNRKTLQEARIETARVNLGDRGVTESDLRPAGIARFDDRRESVVSPGEFIGTGVVVEVVEVQGSRIVVEDVRAEEND